MSEQRTNLLALLASIPPEDLVPGTQIEVTKVSGEKVTMTLGEWQETPAPDWQIALAPTTQTHAVLDVDSGMTICGLNVRGTGTMWTPDARGATCPACRGHLPA